jgi:two-component system, OmpR family, alkaline phosphatase synthesis response regulator PhoP
MSERAIRLLLIDDEASIREVTKATLEATGNWDVTLADAGSVGVELATKIQPDLILVDLMMPDMDGVATYNALRQQESISKIPVAFFTAKANMEERQQFDDMGVCGVISKPFEPLTLSKDLLKLIGVDEG